MKLVNQMKFSRGVGLIEVLIATVVIAIGLLSLASMQGNFMSESGTNKTRAQALVLAEQKVEELRNYITQGQFTDAENSSPANPEEITGSNATFNRTWQISAGVPATATPRFTIAVTVSWGTPVESVAITSQIGYVNANNTAGLASGSGEASHPGAGTISSPNPNVNSSTRSVDIVELLEPDGTTPKAGFTEVTGGTVALYEDEQGNLYRKDGGGALIGRLVDYIDNLMPFELDLRYETNNADPICDSSVTSSPIKLYFKRLDLDGDTKYETIELYTANLVGGEGDGSNMLNLTCTPESLLDGTATRVHTYNGGVILSIKGNIYTDHPNMDHIKIDFDKEDMYCVFNPGISATIRSYACYPGGNCNNGPAGDNADAINCPDPIAADSSVGVGGWRGNVGLINVDDDGADTESICHLEEVLNQETQLSTARQYKGLLSGQEQGVNQSYDCQNYLIIGRRTNFSQLAASCSAAASDLGITSLPTKEVTRTIVSSNTVAGVSHEYCNNVTPKDYTITVTVNRATDTTAVTIQNNSCTADESTPRTYTCTGETRGASLEVSATDPVNGMGICNASLTGPTNFTGDCEMTLLPPPEYTLNGNIYCKSGNDPDGTCATTGGQAVSISISDGLPDACTLNGTNFTCILKTLSTVADIITTKGNRSDYCTVIELDANTTTRENVCVLRFD